MIVEIQENDSMECTGNDYKISILKVGCDQINPGGLIIIFMNVRMFPNYQSLNRQDVR